MKTTTIYCQICSCSYKLKDLISWTGRDCLDFLCPGCDDILFSPDCFKCSNSATSRLTSNGKIYYYCDKHYPFSHHGDDNDVKNSNKASWYRNLYNGYEPDNRIRLTGELVEDSYVVFEIWGSLTFNDGHFFVSIHRTDNGEFVWRNDDIVGTASSFMSAWEKMPAYVTDPDEYDESPMTFHD
jgi:hypothetical protein